MLRRIALSLLIICTLTTAVNGQELDPFSQKAVQKGDVIITANYGVPSILRYFLKKETPVNDVGLRGSGPYLLKGAYMLSNKISMSLNVSYNYTNVYWYQDGYLAGTGYSEYEYGAKANELGFNLRGDYHFINKNKWDVYAGIGAGYGWIRLNTYTLHPNGTFDVAYEIPDPLSFELTAGARYFLHKNIAINAEAGLGRVWLLYRNYFIPDALGQLGLSFRL